MAVRALTLPSNGDEREDRALLVAAAITAIYVSAEIALITSAAAAVRTAILGHGNARHAAQVRLERQAAIILALAYRQALRAVATSGLDPVPAPVAAALGNASSKALSSVTSAAARAALAGGADPSPLLRLRSAQGALDDALSGGITGFTDAAGRDWDLASYAGMTSATGVSNAWDDMLASDMQERGLGLVLVTHGSEPICGNCAPYLGRLLSLDASITPGSYTVLDAAGKSWTAEVAATLAQAKGAGFRHPNCRCSLIEYDDGADLSEAGRIPPSPEVLAARYAAAQKRNAAQRRERAARRQQAAAFTPQARARARVALAALDVRTITAVHQNPQREHRTHVRNGN